MTETDKQFDLLMKNSKQQITKLINKLIKKMEKEGEVNEWHTLWQRLFHIVNFSYLTLYFYETQIMTNEIQKSAILKLFNVNNINKEFAINTMTNFDKIHKATLLTTFLFHVETTIKQINDALPHKTKERKFVKIAKHVINTLDLSDKPKKIDAVKGPVLLRNIQHSGGIYDDSDDNVWIKGKNYKFENGKTPNLSSWENICIFLDELVNVTDDIISAYKETKQSM